jgi:hypothetical protein
LTTEFFAKLKQMIDAFERRAAPVKERALSAV